MRKDEERQCRTGEHKGHDEREVDEMPCNCFGERLILEEQTGEKATYKTKRAFELHEYVD